MPIEVLHDVDTEINADSVEWCPLQGYEDILACGTYQLDKTSEQQEASSDSRHGCVHIFSLESSGKLKNICHLNGTGILDIKWIPHTLHNTKVMFAAAKSDGCLDIYCLKTETEASLEIHESIKVEDNSLCLSLDCISLDSDSFANSRVLVSTSLGSLCVIDFLAEGSKLHTKWKAHDLETWICSFDHWNSALLYSGADDCKLKGWDLRTDNNQATFVAKNHEMGVTSLQCNPFKEHCLASGSYDENIILWDTRSMKIPVSSLSVGGGIWRLKWEPGTGVLLAAACMHNGVQLIDCSAAPVIAESFTQHESITYGVDWARRQKSKSTNESWALAPDYVLASCSFYDNSLKLWNWRLKVGDHKLNLEK